MDRIDELLEKATPSFARRDRLRSVFTERERVKSATAAREEPQPQGAGVVICAVDSEEFEQIREELAEAGVPAEFQSPAPPAGGTGTPAAS